MKQKRSLRFSTLLMAFRTVVGVLASYAAISPASASELSAYLRTYAVASGGSEDEKVFTQTITPTTTAEWLSASSTSNSIGRFSDDHPPSSYSDGYVSAQYAVLKARVDSINIGGGVAQTGAETYFSDVMSVHSPYLYEVEGTARINLLAIWDLINLNGGNTSAFAQVQLGSSVAVLRERVDCMFGDECERTRSLVINGVEVPFSMSFTLTVPLVFDEDIVLQMWLQTNSTAAGVGDAPEMAVEAAVLGHRSYYWGGIEEVTYGGTPVEFTVTSESGTNYRSSFVPSGVVSTPPVLWLFVTAFAFLGLARGKS